MIDADAIEQYKTTRANIRNGLTGLLANQRQNQGELDPTAENVRRAVERSNQRRNDIRLGIKPDKTAGYFGRGTDSTEGASA